MISKCLIVGVKRVGQVLQLQTITNHLKGDKNAHVLEVHIK